MYDIIIVGGGPAGAAAALYAEKAGLKSIILEKAKFPRDKICGDALSGKTIKILRDLDLIDELEQLDGSHINRITFGSPTNNQFDINLKSGKKENHVNKGYVIPRLVFDNFLFQKASLVTDTLENFTVKDVIYQNGQMKGVNGIDKKGNKNSIEAPLVFGCDGANSIIARKVGLYSMDMKNTAVAIRRYYEGVGSLTDQIELHYLKEVKPGYFWLFPAGDGMANIGVGISKESAKKEDRTLNQIMNEIISSDYFRDRFRYARPIEKPKGWNLPMGSIHRKNHGNGYMLLGDAAGLVDPFTGEGIGNARVAAKYAVDVAKEAKGESDFSEKKLKKYDYLVWSELGGELNVSTKLQKLAHSSFLLNFVINRASRNENVQEIIAGMLSNEMARDDLSNPMFYFKILFS